MGILLSRVSGLLRERAIGHFLGTGLAVEAFRAALRIPNLLQNLLGEGVLSASFIPVHARLLSEGRERDAARVAGAVAGAIALLASGLTVVGVVFARPIAAVVAAGWSGEKLDVTASLIRVITPGVGLLVLSAWALGILNSHRRFFLSYVAPVLWNAAMVAALVGGGLRGLTGTDLAAALAWGTLAGSALQLAVQLPAVVRLTPGLRPRLRWVVPETAGVFRSAVPVLLGRGVVQVLAFLTLMLASLLSAGAVAALTYAQVLYLLPISLFGMSVAAAELPALSSGQLDARRASARLGAGARRISYFVAPCALVYLVLGDRVVALLYRTGRFDHLEVLQVGAVLAAYSLGLLATTQARLLQSSLYAVGNTRAPALLSVLRVGTAVALGSVLMVQFDAFRLTPQGVTLTSPLPVLTLPAPETRIASENALRLGAVGLAVGTAVAAWLEYGLLRRAVRRSVVGARPLGSPLTLRHGAAAAAAAAAGLAARGTLDAPAVVSSFAPLFLVGVVYLGATLVLRDPEATALLRRRPRRQSPEDTQRR